MKNPKIQAGILFLLVLASRLPFLFAGFGMDPDSWQMARAAHFMGEYGKYITSRFPGYPFPELLFFLLPDSYFAVNFSSALFSAVAAVFMFLLLRHFRLPFALLTALAFSAVPVVYISSTSAIDYLWALAFILAAYFSAIHKRLFLAGLLLGFSLSCRLTSILALLPLLLLIPLQPTREYAKLAVGVFLGSLAYFIPMISSYGFSFFTYYSGPVFTALEIVDTATERVWGRIGVVVLAGVVAMQAIRWLLKKDKASWDSAQKRLLLAGGVGAIIYLLLFLYLPHEPGYLIPFVLYLMMLFPLLLNRKLLLVFVAGCLASPFVTFGRIGIYKGPILLDKEYREYNLAHFHALLQQLKGEEKPILLVAGWYAHALNYLKTESDSTLLIVYRVEKDGEITHYHYERLFKSVKEAQEAGYHILLIKEMHDEYKADWPEPKRIPVFPDLEEAQ